MAKKPGPVPGQNTILTPEVLARIVQAVSAGNYLETAAAFAGVSSSSIQSWLRQGRQALQRLEREPYAKLRKAEALFVELLAAVERASAQAEVRDVATIVQASKDQWQAAAWRLERRHPDRWGRRDTLDVNQHADLETKRAALRALMAQGDMADALRLVAERAAQALAPPQAALPAREAVDAELVPA